MDVSFFTKKKPYVMIIVKRLGIISKKKKKVKQIIKVLLEKNFIYGFNYIESLNIKEILKTNKNVDKKIEKKNKQISEWDEDLRDALKDFVADVFDYHKFQTGIVITPDGDYYAEKNVLDKEWINNYNNDFLEKYSDCYLTIYNVEVEVSNNGELFAYTNNINDDVKFKKKGEAKHSDYTYITDEPVFLIEHTGGGWSTYQDTIIVTNNGLVYKSLNDEPIYVDSKTIEEIKANINNSLVKFEKKIDETELKELLSKVPDVRIDSESYCTGAGFDGGEVAYYVINEKIDDKPVLVGIRFDRSIHSRNESEEFIANWLAENIYGR